MKKTLSLILAVLCMVTLSFSSVVFAADTAASTYEIKTSAQHGTITDSVKGNVGKDVKIAYKPDNGYQLKTLTVDSKSQDIAKYPSSYTFSKPSGTHSITAVYELIPGISKERSADLKSEGGKTTVTYTVKIAQTVKGAELRDVVVEETLPNGITIDKDSIKGDGVKVSSVEDHKYKATIDSIKDSATYTYKATVTNGNEADKLLGTITASAANFKSASSPSVTPAAETPAGNDNSGSNNSGNSGNTDNQTPATNNDGNNSGNNSGSNNQSDNGQQTPGTNNNQGNQAGNDQSGNNNQGSNNQQNEQPVVPTTTIEPAVTKTVSNANPSIGDTVDYTIVVNMPQGITSMGEVVLTDHIPEGINVDMSSIKIVGSSGKITATSSTDTTSQNNDKKFYVTFDNFDANTTVTFSAKVTAKSGDVTNEATVTGTNIKMATSSAKFTVKEETPTTPTEPEKEFSLSDTVYVAKDGEHWHYDPDCDGLNHVDAKSIDKMTLEKAKKTLNRGKTNTTGHKYLIECPDCAKGSTAATGGPYKEDMLVSTYKPEFKKTADKKEVALSGIVKYTVTASVKDDKVKTVTINDSLPSGMELVKDSIKASDKGSITIKDNTFNVTYKSIEKKTVTITYEAKAIKEGDQKNVASMSYTDTDSKSGSVKAEATVKVSGQAGDSTTTGKDGEEGRPNYKTGDFLPYILMAVLIVLLGSAYAVYRKRNADEMNE